MPVGVCCVPAVVLTGKKSQNENSEFHMQPVAAEHAARSKKSKHCGFVVGVPPLPSHTDVVVFQTQKSETPGALHEAASLKSAHD